MKDEIKKFEDRRDEIIFFYFIKESMDFIKYELDNDKKIFQKMLIGRDHLYLKYMNQNDDPRIASWYKIFKKRLELGRFDKHIKKIH